MLQFQLRRLLRGRVAGRAPVQGRVFPAAVHTSSESPKRQSTASTLAAASAVAGQPTAADLPDLRSVPGSSAYGTFEYGTSDAPYPIYMLDPHGALYRGILWVARNSSEVLEAVHDASGLPWYEGPLSRSRREGVGASEKCHFDLSSPTPRFVAAGGRRF